MLLHKTTSLETEVFHLVILASILLLFKDDSREMLFGRGHTSQRHKQLPSTEPFFVGEGTNYRTNIDKALNFLLESSKYFHA